MTIEHVDFERKRNILKLQYKSTKKGDLFDHQCSFEEDLLQQLTPFRQSYYLSHDLLEPSIIARNCSSTSSSLPIQEHAQTSYDMNYFISAKLYNVMGIQWPLPLHIGENSLRL